MPDSNDEDLRLARRTCWAMCMACTALGLWAFVAALTPLGFTNPDNTGWDMVFAGGMTVVTVILVKLAKRS